MKFRLLTIFSILLVMAFITTPAAASTPDQVRIESVVSFSSGSGTFEASGLAVEAGLICPAGEVYDKFKLVAGTRSGILQNLMIHKTFVCADGSGTFEMDLKVHLVFEPYKDATQWVVTGGDGAYARLRGAGGLYGIPVDSDHVLDIYSGGLHID